MNGAFYMSVTGDITEFNIPQPLAPGNYHWQVVAYQDNNFEIGRSTSEEFNIVQSSEDASFELLYPIDVTIDDTTPLFDWTDIDPESGAEHYHIYIDNTLIPTLINIDTSEFQLTEDSPLDEGSYTWYVTATRKDEIGDETFVSQTDTATFEIFIPDIPPEETPEDPTDTKTDIQKIIQPIAEDFIPAAAIGTAVIVTPMIYGISPLDIHALLVYSFDKLLILLGFRKKGSKWGVVYNSISKHPIKLAVVRLFKNSQLLETKVTGLNGRFEFESTEGTYTLQVQHRNFDFPSKIITGHVDDTYRNIYKGGSYEVQSEKTFIEVSVPVDPKKLSPIQLQLKRITSTLKTILVLINPFLLTAGIVITGRTFLLTGNLVALVITVLNAIFICLYFYELYKEKARWGIVVDKTGTPMKQVKLGLYDKTYEKLVATRVTDAKGKYSFLVPGDTYRIRVLDKEYAIDDKKNIQGYIVGKKGKRDTFAVTGIVVRRIGI